MTYNNMPMPYQQPYSGAFMPQTYAPYYAQSYGQQYQQATQPQQLEFNDHINWCQGIEGAKAFYVPAGRSAQIMDSEGPFFYIKTVDVSGIPSPLRIFRYSEELTAQAANKNEPDFVTRREVQSMVAQAVAAYQQNGGNDNA